MELTGGETSVIRPAEAIQKTQKRANALSNVQIPRCKKTIKSIDEKGRARTRRIQPPESHQGPKEKQAEEAWIFFPDLQIKRPPDFALANFFFCCF